MVIPAAMFPDAMDETNDGPGLWHRPFYGINTVTIWVIPVEFFCLLHNLSGKIVKFAA